MDDKNLIEISLPVQIFADVGFWIERGEWAAMDDATKRKRIGERIERACQLFRDVMRIEDDGDDKAFLSAGIDGPEDDLIDLDRVNVYDPELD